MILLSGHYPRARVIRFRADACAVRTRIVRRQAGEQVIGWAVGMIVPHAGQGWGLRRSSPERRAAAMRWRDMASGPSRSAKRRSFSAAIRLPAGEMRRFFFAPLLVGNGVPVAIRALARVLNSSRVRSSM